MVRINVGPEIKGRRAQGAGRRAQMALYSVHCTLQYSTRGPPLKYSGGGGWSFFK